MFQLPFDTRVCRDEIFPGTRFKSLSEITNFGYRLNYANISITEMFIYLIDIINSVQDSTSFPAPPSQEHVNNHLTDRQHKTQIVMDHTGVRTTETNEIFKKAYQEVLKIVASLPKSKQILLASVLGVTVLMKQPILVHSVTTMSGDTFDIKEPKFK